MTIFITLFLIYFTVVVLLKIRVFRIEGDKGGEVKDNWTFPATYTSYFIAVWGSLGEFFIRGHPSDLNLWVSIIGYLLATAGILVTRRSVLTLGRWWSIRIEIKKSHQVIETGPYRFCRHPYYLGAFSELTGLSLILNSFHVLLYVILIHSLILIARIISEERVLVDFLGPRYLDYKRNVSTIPFSSWRAVRKAG